MPIKKDTEISGCIKAVPTVKGNLIVGKLKLDNETLPIVAFNSLDAKIKQKLFNLQLDQTVMILGRIEPESKMGKRIIANDVVDAEEAVSVQVADKLEEDLPYPRLHDDEDYDAFLYKLGWDMAECIQNYKPDTNEYPAPLFYGDPYAIDPSRDFLENIKTYKIGELIFYTDGKMYWLKDHKTLRNKVFITSSVQEQFARLDNPLAEFATY